VYFKTFFRISMI